MLFTTVVGASSSWSHVGSEVQSYRDDRSEHRFLRDSHDLFILKMIIITITVIISLRGHISMPLRMSAAAWSWVMTGIPQAN